MILYRTEVLRPYIESEPMVSWHPTKGEAIDEAKAIRKFRGPDDACLIRVYAVEIAPNKHGVSALLNLAQAHIDAIHQDLPAQLEGKF